MKMCGINLKGNRYKLTASDNIIYSILNYKLKRPVSFLRLPKEQKQQIQEKNWLRKVSKALNELFTKFFSMFN